MKIVIVIQHTQHMLGGHTSGWVFPSVNCAVKHVRRHKRMKNRWYEYDAIEVDTDVKETVYGLYTWKWYQRRVPKYKRIPAKRMQRFTNHVPPGAKWDRTHCAWIKDGTYYWHVRGKVTRWLCSTWQNISKYNKAVHDLS